jgi:phenylacetate-CoA oxygenase PaaH subunit
MPDLVFEVFRQERKGKPLEHAGSFHAPDERAAEVYAREFYGRRDESEALWLVPRSAVHEIHDFPDEFDRSYRRVDGYSLRARLREARERAAALGPASGGEAA